MDHEASIAIRDQLLQQRAHATIQAQRDLFSMLGEVDFVSYDEILPCVTISATRNMITSIEQNSYVYRIFVGLEISAQADGEGTWPAVKGAVQHHIFRYNNDLGSVAPTSGNQFSRLTAAVVDSGFADGHRAFKDNSTQSRIFKRYACSSTSCLSSSNLPGAEHGTRVAGSLASDLMNGQDPAYTDYFTDQPARTSIASRAGLLLLTAGQVNGTNQAFNRIIADGADVVNYSMGYDGETCDTISDLQNNFTVDKKCRGELDAAKIRINLAYEDGIFVVKSAGNDGAGSANCQCMVTNPGDAEGAFPVAALRVIDGQNGEADSLVSNHALLRQARHASSSARGGGELGGFINTTRERTLIGMAAPTNHANTPSCDDDTGSCDYSNLSEYNRTDPGTSFAAPVVAAASLLVKDMWISQQLPSTWLNNAGNMRTQMLLMGDRIDSDHVTRRTRGFSDRYGAGRLKLRHRSSMGLDAPAFASSGYIDIEDGEVFERWLSPSGTAQALPAAVDYIKLVAWWFEDDTVVLTPHITMQLAVFDSSCTYTQVLPLSDASADTRKHIFKDGLNSNCLRMRIIGTDVPPGDTRRVFWAYYYEDDARDDPEGPTLHDPISVVDVELP